MDDPVIRNLYGYPLPMTAKELMQAEARRTKIESLKREMGNKYLLAPLYGKLKDKLK